MTGSRSHNNLGQKYIFVVTPGGIEVQGGMATMARYMLAEWEQTARRPPMKLINTYGPNLQNIRTMPFYFVAAAATILVHGLLQRIAVLHLHMAEYGSVLRKGLLVYLGKALGIPVVIHMHGAKFTTMWETASPCRRSAMLAIFRHTNAIIVLGEFWRKYLVDHLNQPTAKIRVVPNGVPDLGPNDAPSPATGEPFNILFAGQVGQRKGVGDLLEALARPNLRDLAWRLTIAGGGEVDLHREKARQLGIADRVTFLGWVDLDEVRQLMRTAHIFVLPSQKEGLPMAIIEAMACALPVVATPVGSIPDMIHDRDTGLLVPPGDPAALSAAFLCLLQAPELRAKMGVSARQLYLRDFTASAMCDRIAAVFQSVIRSKP
jgi:glycosyltransferase involved in cell wall biosynthesis